MKRNGDFLRLPVAWLELDRVGLWPKALHVEASRNTLRPSYASGGFRHIQHCMHGCSLKAFRSTTIHNCSFVQAS